MFAFQNDTCQEWEQRDEILVKNGLKECTVYIEYSVLSVSRKHWDYYHHVFIIDDPWVIYALQKDLLRCYFIKSSQKFHYIYLHSLISRSSQTTNNHQSQNFHLCQCHYFTIHYPLPNLWVKLKGGIYIPVTLAKIFIITVSKKCSNYIVYDKFEMTKSWNWCPCFILNYFHVKLRITVPTYYGARSL